MSPEVHGLPIEIAFLPAPREHRGKLLSGNTASGREVHAGSFLRQRRIVLDAALKKQPRIARYVGEFLPAQVEKVFVELGGKAFLPKQAALDEHQQHARAHGRDISVSEQR